MLPNPHDAGRPRFVPEIPFPPYTYVPGRCPHPFSDPAGHQYAKPRGTASALDLAEGPRHRDFLLGCDLFNHGFYWEAHETWEGLWHAAGRRGMTADFLKGLIHLAAAGVKHLEDVPRGVHSHANRTAKLWRDVALSRASERTRFMGLAIEALILVADEIGQTGWPVVAPQIVPDLV